MPTSTQLSRSSGVRVLGNSGVSCMPRQPMCLAPSSTSRYFRNDRSGSTWWRWPVSWSTLGNLQLEGGVLESGWVDPGGDGGRFTERYGRRRGRWRRRACCWSRGRAGPFSTSLRHTGSLPRRLGLCVSGCCVRQYSSGGTLHEAGTPGQGGIVGGTLPCRWDTVLPLLESQRYTY